MKVALNTTITENNGVSNNPIYVVLEISFCLVILTIILVVLGRTIWIRHHSRPVKHHAAKIEIETMFTELPETPDTILSSQRRPLDEVVRYVTEDNSPYVIRQIEKSDYYYYG